MSISDELMWSYYDLLTDFGPQVILRVREEVRTGVLHPMDAKMQLAHAVIAGFHGEEAATKARDEFQRVFRDRQAPDEAPRRPIARKQSPYRVTTMLYEARLVTSNSEAARLIEQGGVEIDGQRIDDVRSQIDISQSGREYLIRAGKKKFLRIIVE
jgi:tyrosyl-tRNA synthetase